MTKGSGTSASTTTSGIGFLGALAIAFIVLKLCGVIGWSWWWVLAPVWMVTALVVVIAVFGGAIYWALGAVDRQDKARRDRERRTARQAQPHEHGPRRRWGARPVPVYGWCPRHDVVHEMLKYGRMCDGWEPADPSPVEQS